MTDQHKKHIDQLITSFFSVFDNRKNKSPDLSVLYEMFHDKALITTHSKQGTASMNLDEFIKPRQELFEKGSLTAFHEWEVEEKTFISQSIATRVSHYKKQGIMSGEEFFGEGFKHIQMILSSSKKWKITSILWQDIST